MARHLLVVVLLLAGCAQPIEPLLVVDEPPACVPSDAVHELTMTIGVPNVSTHETPFFQTGYTYIELNWTTPRPTGARMQATWDTPPLGIERLHFLFMDPEPRPGQQVVGEAMGASPLAVEVPFGFPFEGPMLRLGVRAAPGALPVGATVGLQPQSIAIHLTELHTCERFDPYA